MASIIGIIILLLLIGGFAGLIVLQVKLSRKSAAIPGLILPIVSFVIAAVITLAYIFLACGTASATHTSSIGGYDEDGDFVAESEITEYYESVEDYEIHEETASVGIAVFPVLIMYFTPTIVFLIIYFACHPTKKRLAKKTELDKMSISDL